MSPDKDILENCLFNSEFLREQGEYEEKMKEGKNPTKPNERKIQRKKCQILMNRILSINKYRFSLSP